VIVDNAQPREIADLPFRLRSGHAARPLALATIRVAWDGDLPALAQVSVWRHVVLGADRYPVARLVDLPETGAIVPTREQAQALAHAAIGLDMVARVDPATGGLAEVRVHHSPDLRDVLAWTDPGQGIEYQGLPLAHIPTQWRAMMVVPRHWGREQIQAAARATAAITSYMASMARALTYAHLVEDGLPIHDLLEEAVREAEQAQAP